jgi:hypothetical protein
MTAMRRQSLSLLRQSLLACACAALLVVSGGLKASAQQAEDDDDTFEQKIIKNILGGLGVNTGQAGIDYRERSPLVIPPSRDLPPPQSAGAAAGNAAWPREQQQKKVAVQNRDNRRASPDEPGSSSLLTPDEMRRGINPNATRITDRSQSGSEEEPMTGRTLTPTELGGKSILSWDGLMGGGLKPETKKFEGEPTRGALTQPPTGYQTPSPNYPYAGPADKSSGWKIPTVLSRPEGTPDN